MTSIVFCKMLRQCKVHSPFTGKPLGGMLHYGTSPVSTSNMELVL